MKLFSITGAVAMLATFVGGVAFAQSLPAYGVPSSPTGAFQATDPQYAPYAPWGPTRIASSQAGCGCQSTPMEGVSGYAGTQPCGSSYGTTAGRVQSCDSGYGAGVSYGQYCAPPAPTTRRVASVGSLFVTRDRQNSYTFSFDSANEDVQLVDARNADMGWAPGIEARIACIDVCDLTGFELVYWQLFPSAESTSAFGADLAPGSLDGIRNYDQLDFNGGLASASVNNAVVHRLSRDWEVYNVEANRLIGFTRPCGSPWSHRSLFGFRYLQFSEDLLFVSDPSETMIDGDADEYRIEVDTDNRLYGFQWGGVTEYAATCRLTFTLAAKAGLYGNDISLRYFEGGSGGAATINNGPNNGQMLRLSASKGDIAMLGELSLGAAYQVNCHWTLAADYRVIGVSGVALPTDQLYHDTRGINDVRQVDSNGHLILHGAFFRAVRWF